ncbi:hypothetical protein M0802_013761 [Mischocyttarus mexicanus]|nr:hypothetical protein M0802_013761 [Mischocyttarus mexicanus]
MCITQDMLKKQEDEAKQREENRTKAKRKLEMTEEELRKSLGANFSGCRCFGRPQTPVDSLLTLFEKPAISNQILQTSTETALVVQQTPPSTAPRKQFASIKLRKITEIVPSFDGNNILVSKFVKACSRALESLPLDYTEKTETSLTMLLISKLNGHAVRDLTQSIIEEKSKARKKLEIRIEREIEEERLDAFTLGLPSEYRTEMRLKKYKDCNFALVCILRVNKQIHDDAITSNSSNKKKKFSNIRQIKEDVSCTYCNKAGLTERECQQKLGYYRNEQAKRISPINEQAETRPPLFRNLKPLSFWSRNQQCYYCKKMGHWKAECRKRIYNENQKQKLTGQAKLMIDTGADVNLIKLVAIRKLTDIDSTEIIQLKGISTRIQNTLSTVDINIFGESTVFHVVEDYFPINADGILGNEFLRTIPTAIDDIKEILFVRDKKVPFTESSSLCIPQRYPKFGYYHILNTELREGYIPRLELLPGVYTSEALVKNINGKAYFKISNTNPKSVKFEIPRLDLLAFSAGTVPNSESSTSDSATNIPKSEPSDFLSSIHTISAEADDFWRLGRDYSKADGFWRLSRDYSKADGFWRLGRVYSKADGFCDLVAIIVKLMVFATWWQL